MAPPRAAGRWHDAAEMPAWLRETAGEQRVPVLTALVAAIIFQAPLPVKFLLVPWWAVVIPEALLLAVTVAGNPVRLSRDSAQLRRASLLLAGGPFARMHGGSPYPDLLFPQQSTPEMADPDWEPRFFDYLYLSFTNATAFSPTDTMPMSRWAKLLMLVQSAVALATVGLVIARAVNVLQ